MTTHVSVPTAAVLIIGNEILTGRTQDVNLNAIARKLLSLGINLTEARVVRDVEEEIVEAVNAMRGRVTYVFTTGGIGPTHDDITAASVAKALGLPFVEHAEAKALLTDYYTEKNLNSERLGMALMPQGATLINNPVSVIPGFHIDNIFVLAGVPEVMLSMLDEVASRLERGPAIYVATVNCGVTEGVLAAGLALIVQRYPGVDIGSYPSLRLGKIGVAVVLRGIHLTDVQAATQEVSSLVKAHGGIPVVENAG